MSVNVLLLFLALSCATTPLLAQTVANPTTQNVSSTDRTKSRKEFTNEALISNKAKDINEFGSNGYDVVAFDVRARAVRGTPFLVSSWAMGDVLFGTSPKPVAAVLKFDVFNQQVRVLRPQGDSIVLTPEKVQAFTLRPTGADGKPVDKHFVRLPGSVVPDLTSAFAESLFAGHELQLLKFQRKTILSEKADASYTNNKSTDSFITAAQYYLCWSDGSYAAVKGNKASVLHAVAQRQEVAAKAEANDKSRVRNDAELVELVQRIDAALGAR